MSLGECLFSPYKGGTTGISQGIILFVFCLFVNLSPGYEGGSISKVLSLIQKSTVVSLDRYLLIPSFNLLALYLWLYLTYHLMFFKVKICAVRFK